MYDVIIIGAGVIGAATAYCLSRYNLKVAILEAQNDVACGTTKANAALIHAGYDAKPGSLMAKYNREGSLMMEELCKKLDVPYKRNGSLVLAFDDENLETLKVLLDRGHQNGIEGLKILNKEETKKMEPYVSDECLGSLYAPTAAIVSPWELCLALAETAVRNGVELFLNNRVESISKENDIFTVITDKDTYHSKYIVNAAGVNTDTIHEMIGEKEFTISANKGQYYLFDKAQGYLTTKTLFPCPSTKGKGCAVTPTVGGNLVIGPDSSPCTKDDLDTTAEGLMFVKKASSRMVPKLDFRENIRNFAGLRAKCDRDDFIVEESKSVRNFFNLAGIASPGLSSSIAIGNAVLEWLKSKEKLIEKENFIDSRKRIKFMSLSDEEKNELIKKNPAYGRIICRCELITEGEILETFNTPIPPVSIDGVKRRVKAGMGRCQGGFCGEKVAMILKDKLGLEYDEILQDKKGSNILFNEAKGGQY
ncbi:MAG: NAD(P)/FAD-dependent oxidoreductase [Erysipelotrichaceae bacterium]|nr:NAD(P)/FAD-dependent oxidoreductase [Erysipelotrichaceae bacterium]